MKIFLTAFFFRKEIYFLDGVFLEKKIFFMGRGTYTETDNWVAAKISWEPRPYGNPKFEITFRYLNMYVSTQKFPQTFLYRSKKYCKKFKSFGELEKKYIQQQNFAGGHFAIGEKLHDFDCLLLRGLFSNL